jgi:RNA-binding protein
MPLTNSQRRFLKGRAHALKPVITVGNAGVSDSLLEELDVQLKSHELLKLRLRVDERTARDECIAQLVASSGAELVSRVGNVAILYRARLREPGLVLPR